MDRYKAIYNTHPSVVTINGYQDSFDADGNPVILDESLITAELTRLQEEFDSQEYARNTVLEYPNIVDQLY